MEDDAQIPPFHPHYLLYLLHYRHPLAAGADEHSEDEGNDENNEDEAVGTDENSVEEGEGAEGLMTCSCLPYPKRKKSYDNLVVCREKHNFAAYLNIKRRRNYEYGCFEQ